METSAYCFWPSPIEAGFFSSFPSLQELHVSKDEVFWTESRPLEKGRSALLKKGSQDLFPSMNVQSKVHEYGGGAFLPSKDDLLFYDAFSSSLYWQKDGELICLIQDPQKRWADFAFSSDHRKAVCVCEDHSHEKEVKNKLMLIDLENKTCSILEELHDFYASPKWSLDDASIAFLYWDHPFMPWQTCFLKVISVEEKIQQIQIGIENESIAAFDWSRKNEIIFASDRNGFWNLYRHSSKGSEILYEKEADFASPIWTLGKKHFALYQMEGKEYLACFFTEKGVDHLGIFSLEEKKMEIIPLPYQTIRTLDVDTGGIYLIGGSFDIPLEIARLDPKTKQVETCYAPVLIPEALKPYLSKPEEVSALSSVDGKKVFGFFYPPKNPDCELRNLPPLIIKCHAGPTSHVPLLFNAEAQFWTSRGFAWLDINYRGSSGFGRNYREALNGQWGVLDAKDALDLALCLVREGKVDPNALFAKGGSSGGLTALTLALLYPNLRGCSVLYGVTDLSKLLEESHKFEQYYLHSLIGDPVKDIERYKNRSPVFFADRIKSPLLLFHGDLDKVVPLSQAEALQKKAPFAKLVVFPGEGHGFKKADTLKALADIELDFFQKMRLSYN